MDQYEESCPGSNGSFLFSVNENFYLELFLRLDDWIERIYIKETESYVLDRVDRRYVVFNRYQYYLELSEPYHRVFYS